MSSTDSDLDASGSEEDEAVTSVVLPSKNRQKAENAKEKWSYQLPLPISPTLPPVESIKQRLQVHDLNKSRGPRNGASPSSDDEKARLSGADTEHASMKADPSLEVSSSSHSYPLSREQRLAAKRRREGTESIAGHISSEHAYRNEARSAGTGYTVTPKNRTSLPRSLCADARCLVRLKLSMKQPSSSIAQSSKARLSNGVGTNSQQAVIPSKRSTDTLPRTRWEKAPPYLRHSKELETSAGRFRELGRRLKHQADAREKARLAPDSQKPDMQGWLAGRVESAFVYQEALLMYTFSFWCEEEALGNRTQVVDNWRSLFAFLRFVIRAWSDIASKVAVNKNRYKVWEIATTMTRINAVMESAISFHLADLAQSRLLRTKMLEAHEVVKRLGQSPHALSKSHTGDTPPSMAEETSSGTTPTYRTLLPPEILKENAISPQTVMTAMKVLQELTDQSKRVADDIANSKKAWEASEAPQVDPFSKAGKTIVPTINNAGWLCRVSPNLWDLCEESTRLAGSRRGWSAHDLRDEIPFALCARWNKKYAATLDKESIEIPGAAPDRPIAVIWPLTTQKPILYILGFTKAMMEVLVLLDP